MLQFFDDFCAKDAIAFPVDKDYSLPFLLDVPIHHDTELCQLGVQEHAGRKAFGMIQKRMNMKVNFDDFFLCRYMVRL